MKKANANFLGIILILFSLNVATAQDWQTIFQTNFSSDPGWTTNNPDNHYWNPEGTYFADQYNIDYGGEYTYHDAGYHGCSFTLEWDIIIDYVEYASDLSFGIFDADLSTSTENFVRVAFTNNDQGNVVFVEWRDNMGINGFVVDNVTHWSLDTWYHVVMEYNSSENTVVVEITERDTGTPLLTLNGSDVGPFDSEMGLLGNSNVRTGPFQCNGCHTYGKFDNVNFALDFVCGDVNGDCTVDILDIVHLINYKYKSGSDPECP